MKHTQSKNNGTKRHLRMLAILLVPMVAVILGVAALEGWAKGGHGIEELDEAAVYIEWNSTDTDYGIQFFWDSIGFTRMTVKNTMGKKVLDVKTSKNVKAQGLTEGFFESVEPPSSELPMEEFLDRFPEGEYKFRGISIEKDWLVGETEFTHDLPEPPQNLEPAEDDVVSHLGFTASFDHNHVDTDGEPLDIVLYVVVVEKENDDPILQTFTVILPPTMTEVDVPAQFLEPDTEYKLEVIAQEESGNRTITETGPFTTD